MATVRKQDYYRFPLNFGKMMMGEEHEKCNLEESIKNHIQLILDTCLGEYDFDNTYGFPLWDEDYSIIDNQSQWIRDIKNYIYAALTEYEKRIIVNEKEITVQVEQQNFNNTFTIEVNARLIRTDTPIKIVNIIYFNPKLFSKKGKLS